MGRGSRELEVGVIGVGGISRAQHLPHWHAHGGVRLTALADVDTRRLNSVAGEYGVERTFADWRELIALEELDIVDITTPNRFHAPMAVAALEAGKHVLCEKPMATCTADAELMVDAARRAGRLLMINHVFRFSSVLTDLRSLVGNRMGRIHHAHAKWTRRRGVPVAETFISRELAGGGPVVDLGVHMIDLACWMMGFPDPQRVSARAGAYLAGRPDLGGEWGQWDRDVFDVEDFGVGLFHFAGGATLLLEVSWLGFRQSLEERSLQLLGDRGGVRWPEGTFSSESDGVPFDTTVAHAETGSAFRRSIHAFTDAVRAGRPSPIPPEDSLQVIRMVEAFYLSAREDREVRF